MILLPHDSAVIQTEAPLEGTKPGLWGHALADWPTKVAAATESIKPVGQVDPVHSALLPSTPNPIRTTWLSDVPHPAVPATQKQPGPDSERHEDGLLGGWLQTSTVVQGRGKPSPTWTVCMPKETAQLTRTEVLANLTR